MAIERDASYVGQSWSEGYESSQSTTRQESISEKVLNAELLNTILSGLSKQMTDKEISEFAENLLKPQLNAGLEAADQTYATTKLAKEQEKENLAAALARAIMEQQVAYKQNMADVETAALARGMGRSSYTLQTLANQGNALAQVIRQLTDESTRQQSQIQDQITLAAQQQTQTKNRLNTDYAANLAAKVQELRQQQQQRWDSNYMTAVSASMGNKTTGTSQTTGSSSSMGVSGVITDPNAGGGGVSSGSSSSKNNGGGSLPSINLSDDIDVISY